MSAVETNDRITTATRPVRRPWVIVTAGAVATIMSAPGQTAAISVFTDPLIAELGVSRNALSTSYLIGTLTGAAMMPLIGRALDRFGIGRVMAVVAAIFGAVLMALSLATNLAGLTAGFIGIRMAGQGALGLASSTAVAVHVTHRRGLALGIKTAIGSAGIALAPVFLEKAISSWGMSTTWLVEGLAVWVIVIPIALIIFRDRPHRRTIRRKEDAQRAVLATPDQWTTADAIRTPMFWVIAAALASSGMLTTGLNFHQIAALGEQGLTAGEAALNFVPQAVATMAVTIGVGALADKIAPKYGVVVAMLLLTGSLLTLSTVTSAVSALLYGGLLGAAGGTVRTVEAAAFTHYFGTTHIGAISGIATTISVGSTAFGPLALSLGHGITGSYATTALAFAALPVAVAAAAAFVRPPQRSASAPAAPVSDR